MKIEKKHLEEFLAQIFDVYKVALSFDDNNRTATIDLEAGSPTSITELETICRIFGSFDVEIPAWDVPYKGCDTCGHGSIANLDGIIIKKCQYWDIILKEAAIVRWEQELQRAEAARIAEERARQKKEEQERRRKANIAQQKREKKLKEQRRTLLKDALRINEAFEALWAVHEPLINLRKEVYIERIKKQPKRLRWIHFKFRKTKQRDKEGLRHRFMQLCEQRPKKVAESLFPNTKGAEDESETDLRNDCRNRNRNLCNGTA
jgi:hypothetical protein